MLVHAMNSSRVTELNSSQRERRELPIVVSLSGSDAYGELRVGFGKLTAELCLHGGEIRASLCDRDAGFEASNDDEPVVLPA